MPSTDHLTHGHRALWVGVLGAVALAAVALWAVVNLLEGDWFIAALFGTSVLLGAPSLVSTTRRLRREDRSRTSRPRGGRR